MKVGIVFGCFIPLHVGHVSLIKKALNENDKVIIGVCGFDGDRGKDFVPFRDRINLMTKRYGKNPKVVLSVVDDKKIGLTGKFDTISWVYWSSELFTNANFDPDDEKNTYTWYTGEENYVSELSLIFPKHKFNLIDRQICKVSGTQIRNNPNEFKDDIIPIYQEYLKEHDKL